MSDFDLITDRRNLRLLFAFAVGTTQELQIDTEVAGETVLANGTPSAGHGAIFEKRFTEYPQNCPKTIMHNGIITYTLGGLCLLVRFEVDECLRPPAPINTDTHQFQSQSLLQV